MTTDLFFAPAMPQKSPSTFQCDKAGSVSPDPFSKTTSSDSSKGSKHETFLTTLRKASRDPNPPEGSRQSVSPAANRSEKTDRHPVDEPGGNEAPVGDDNLNDIISLLDNDEVSLDLNQLIGLLEKLGSTVSSGEPMSLSTVEGAVERMSSPAEKALDRLAALKQLLGTIQPNNLKPGNEMTTGLERLRQLITHAMVADTSVHNHSGPKEGLHANQLLDPGQANAIRISGAVAVEGTGGEKPVDMHLGMSQVLPDSDSVSKEPGIVKTGESSQIPPQSESAEKTGTVKLHPDMRAAAEANAAAKDMKAQEMVPGETGDAKRNADVSRSLAAADKGPRAGGEPPVENSLTGESSSVSKLINDARVEKDNPLKGDIAPGDEAGSRVVKLEAGTNDSGQLTSQSQPFDKTLESVSAPKEAEAAPRELRTQTMEQIVRRAVIQIRDGQHEARIDLKPDFMGHVRMQVITENQLVTVKIMTEFGFVKDMIENSIQQLKADLQQHGLEVDKIDVSVSRDSQGNKHQQENTEHANNLNHEDESSDHGNDREDQQERPDRSPLRAEGLSTVDYFA